MFLSDDGTVYSCGEDTNNSGVLGLGGVHTQQNPHPIIGLFDHRYSIY
jgi:alpha-tubulin suppressor-like RCC1 family protein